MALLHEVPTGLRVRPSVTVRPLPGKIIRLPARAGTLLLGAALLWGAAAGLTPLAWPLLTALLLAPAVLLAALVELTPHGKSPLAWAYVLTQRARRPCLLVLTRTVAAPAVWRGR